MIIQSLDLIGKTCIMICDAFGQFSLFLIQAFIAFFSTKPKLKKIVAQMESIGVGSLIIVILTGAFAGAVLALQGYIAFKRIGTDEFLGPLVALSMTRELGPVLTGLMVTARCCSAIAAEIGTMRITEQLDALKTLNINIWQYLIIPRIFAATFILPFLCLFTMICGIAGGYVIAVYSLNLNSYEYLGEIRKYLELSDIRNGLIKSSVFGLILSWVGCYQGYKTHGGAKGVGVATTRAVVIASIMILIANYFLTAILFE